ncbi:ead/Ea22-like family protein [Enterobacter hormaechei]|uniref:ead/Ea22-like family protein n=1 Tax=Enterobacter hormaechei TaxID=158836 RepID=UPI003AB0A791
MSNIDKQAQKELYAKVEQQAHSLRGSPREYQALTGLCPVNVIEMHAQKIQALLDELEAKDKRNTELNEALKQAVSGYKSCLRTGYERILELGGDCDSPEAMIAGNPDIQHAEKLIAAAAGKGE